MVNSDIRGWEADIHRQLDKVVSATASVLDLIEFGVMYSVRRKLPQLVSGIVANNASVNASVV